MAAVFDISMFQHTATRRWLQSNDASLADIMAFQHTATRRRLPKVCFIRIFAISFQHTAARRRLRGKANKHLGKAMVSTHSRPKAAASITLPDGNAFKVSTHSRPKAAARFLITSAMGLRGFNTQPPEGGCWRILDFLVFRVGVSTHSRPKAAASHVFISSEFPCVSTHSRPKAAAAIRPAVISTTNSFNTQPPEGGCIRIIVIRIA